MAQFMREYRQGLPVVVDRGDQIIQYDDRAIGHGERVGSELRRSPEQQLRIRGTALGKLQRLQAGTESPPTLLGDLARQENLAVQNLQGLHGKRFADRG